MGTLEPWTVVLGATGGTGAAVVRSTLRNSARPIFGVHRGHYPEQAQALEQEASAAGRPLVLHVGDAGTFEGVRASVEALERAAGKRRVQLLVHALASASVGPLVGPPDRQLTPKNLEKTMAVMAHSFVWWVQALVERDLLAPSAQLLGLTNTFHDSLVSNGGAVAASKGALEMYVRALAVELGPTGHRVNLLKFGTVITPALQRMLGPQASAGMARVHESLNAAGRICTVEEVADFIGLLARPEAAWMTGATIDFTGGFALRLANFAVEAARKVQDS